MRTRKRKIAERSPGPPASLMLRNPYRVVACTLLTDTGQRLDAFQLVGPGRSAKTSTRPGTQGQITLMVIADAMNFGYRAGLRARGKP